MLGRTLLICCLLLTGMLRAQTTNPDSLRQAEIYYPDTMTAKEIGSMVLDKHVYSFSVSWIINGNMYMYDITGNGIFGDARAGIEALPPGTKVYIENIRRKEDDGSLRTVPNETHIVR